MEMLSPETIQELLKYPILLLVLVIIYISFRSINGIVDKFIGLIKTFIDKLDLKK